MRKREVSGLMASVTAAWIAIGLTTACGSTGTQPQDAGSGGDAGSADHAGPCEGALTFADPQLEAAVRAAAGIPSGDLVQADVDQLEQLQAAAHGITAIDGIECLTGLTELNLRDNPLSDIGPLASLPQLTLLQLEDDEVDDIASVAGMTDLTQLYLGGNEVTDISALAGLDSLAWLELDENGLVDIGPLETPAGLAHIEIDANLITDLTPLANNLAIASGDYVDIVDNPIDCQAQAANLQALRDRGVTLNTDCP